MKNNWQLKQIRSALANVLQQLDNYLKVDESPDGSVTHDCVQGDEGQCVICRRSSSGTVAEKLSTF